MVGPSIPGITTSLINRSSGSPLRENLQRIFAIVGGDDGIAVPGERTLGDAPDHRLVLDQEHGAGAPQLVLLRRRALSRLEAGDSSRWTGR